MRTWPIINNFKMTQNKELINIIIKILLTTQLYLEFKFVVKLDIKFNKDVV